MFRRREDSLFDNAADPSQPMESATVINPPSSVSASAVPTGAPASRAPEPRHAAAPASSFRPNAAPLPSDMTRSRMPEAKTSTVPSGASASQEKNKASGKRVLTVGNDILLKGEIATCDRLVIEGKVDATLNDVHTVEIAEHGSFKGSAHIEDAEISGLFEGDLIVRNRLVIYSTGRVRGKITYGEIEIERGGELTGEIKTGGGAQGNSRPVRKDDKVAA